MKLPLKRRESPRRLGAVHVDGDRARVLVCAAAPDGAGPTLVFDAEVAASEVASALAAAGDVAGGAVDWCCALAGGDAHHEVVEVPPQVRAFPEARLEACLAGTRWGNAEAVESSGYRLGHAFDGDACVLAVARLDALARAHDAAPAPTRVTSAAAALAALVRDARPDLCEPGGPALLALLADATSVAACVLEGGRARLLYQTGLLEHVREVAPQPVAPQPAAPQPAAPAEMEFELSGAYSVPPAHERKPRREPASPQAELESDVYQAALLRVVQEALALYAEQASALAAVPDHVLVTGDGAARHAARAFLARYLGSQFEVDELDAALAVRIDRIAKAREFAAGQASFAGALALVAAARRAEGPFFDLDAERAGSEGAAGARPSDRRAARGRSGMRPLAAAAAAAVALGGGLAAARLAWVSSERAAVEQRLRVERERAERLAAIAAERKAVEAKLAHTRELLGALSSLRARQALPPELLATISAGLPPGTRLDEVSLDGDAVRVAGSSIDRDDVTRFALELERMRDSFANVTPRTESRVVREYDEEAGAEIEQTRQAFVVTAKYVRNVAPEAERRVFEALAPDEPASAALARRDGEGRP